MSTTMKRCQRCLLPKPLDHYYRNSMSKDGRQGYCKGCNKMASAARKTGTGPTQSGGAHRIIVQELRDAKKETCHDLLIALRRPGMARFLKQIKLTEVFPDLKQDVPQSAMVPAGFVFQD